MENKLGIHSIIKELKSDSAKIKFITSKKIGNISLSRYEIVEIAKNMEKDYNRKKIIGMAGSLGLSKNDVCEIACSFIYDNSKKEFIEKMSREGYTSTDLVKVVQMFKYDKNKLEFINDPKKRSEYRLQLRKIIKSFRYENSRKNVIENAKEIGLSKSDIASIITDFKYDSNKKIYLSQDKIKELGLERTDIVNIIVSFQKDVNKQKMLEKRNVEKLGLKKANISLIMSTMREDSAKDKFLKKNTFKLPSLEQLKIICSYSNDDRKLKYLKDINDGKIDDNPNFRLVANMKILSSLKDTSKVLDYIKNGTKIPEASGIIGHRKDFLMMGMFTDKEKISMEQLNNLKNLAGVRQRKKAPDIPKGMTIGIELEAVGKDKRGTQNGILLRRMRNLIGGYTAKRDTSLHGADKGEGVEVISPVMTKKDDLETIPMITEMMKRNGLTTNDTCGGHIHIGADYLDSVEAWKNFFEITKNCETILYKISNPEGSKTRNGIETYAKPYSKDIDIKKTVNLLSEDDLDNFIEEFKSVEKKEEGYDRRYGINLTNINNLSKNTIEFRLFNGTLEHEEVFNNIKLCTRLVEVAKQLGDIEIAMKNNKPLTYQQTKLLNARQNLGKSGDSEKHLAESFLEMMFPNEFEKAVYSRRYYNAPDTEFIRSISANAQNKVHFRNIGLEEDTR